MTAYAAKKFQENATTKTSLTSMLNACSVSKHFYTKANAVTWPVLPSLSCDRIKWLHNVIYITARLNNNVSVPAVYNILISGF